MLKIIAITVFACVLLVQYSETAPAFQILPVKEGYVPVYIRNGDTPLAEISPDLAEAFHESNIMTRQIKMVEVENQPAAEAKPDEKKPDQTEAKVPTKRNADLVEGSAKNKPQKVQAPLAAMKVEEKKAKGDGDKKLEHGKVHSKRDATLESAEKNQEDELAAASEVSKADEQKPEDEAKPEEVKKSSKRQAEAEDSAEKKVHDNAAVAPISDEKPANDTASKDAAPKSDASYSEMNIENLRQKREMDDLPAKPADKPEASSATAGAPADVAPPVVAAAADSSDVKKPGQ